MARTLTMTPIRALQKTKCHDIVVALGILDWASDLAVSCHNARVVCLSKQLQAAASRWKGSP
jgi:hypothetical protein